MNGVKVGIKDVKTGNSFELTKFVIRLIAISKSIYLSDTQLHALTYFAINGYSKLTRDSLVENKLLKTKNCVNNLVYFFKKNGIIIKTTYGNDLHSDFKVTFAENIDIVKIEMLVQK